MNRWLFAAALASSTLLAMHLVGGGVEVYEPLLQVETSDVLKGYVTFLWHAMSLVILTNSAILLLAAIRPSKWQALAWPALAQYAAFALLIFAIALMSAPSVFTMPQWIFFGLVVGLALPGLRFPSGSNCAAMNETPN